MSSIKLSAEKRTTDGKGAARRLRQAGKVPAIVYAGGKDALSVAVNPKELVKALMTPLRRNALLSLDIAGDKPMLVMVKDIQKDPVRREALHVDFVQVDEKVKIPVRVPLVPAGRSKAVVLGAKLTIVTRTLRVRAFPGQVPEKIEIDVTDIGQGAVRASAVPMPAGIDLLEDPNLTVITVGRAKSALEDEPVAAAAAPAAAGKAAPAAAGKAAPAAAAAKAPAKK
jgi:large subunit ribosomal protein L25